MCVLHFCLAIRSDFPKAFSFSYKNLLALSLVVAIHGCPSFFSLDSGVHLTGSGLRRSEIDRNSMLKPFTVCVFLRAPVCVCVCE